VVIYRIYGIGFATLRSAVVHVSAKKHPAQNAI